MGRDYCVYIMTNEFRTLYVGVSGNLTVRVQQHKQKVKEGFTRRYGLTRLAYYESFGDVTRAIEREKQLKGWKRYKKIALIQSTNPEWEDLAEDWYGRDVSFKEGSGCAGR